LPQRSQRQPRLRDLGVIIEIFSGTPDDRPQPDKTNPDARPGPRRFIKIGGGRPHGVAMASEGEGTWR
jgi:hypothetical protein